MTLSGKRTHSGRASGETVLNDGTEGAKEYLFPKLSGKRTETNTYKIIILCFFFSMKRVFGGCLCFILK